MINRRNIKSFIVLMSLASFCACGPNSQPTNGGDDSSDDNQNTTLEPGPSPSPSPASSPNPRASPSPRPRQVRNGPWGGDQTNLFVRSDGALVQWDCAHGTINEPLVLTENNTFHVKGTYASEAGPVHNPPAPEEPAQFFGQIEGDMMTFGMTLENNPSITQVYMLKRGEVVPQHRCL
jgi:hypothetical protein